MSNYLLVWSCTNACLELEIPEKEARFSVTHNNHIECIRGRLSLGEFLHYTFKVLDVYKKMI